MHAYAIQSPEHKTVLFFLAFLSIAITSLLHIAFNYIPVSVSAPSAFATYGVLFVGFDRFMWKWKFLRQLGLIKTPYFNGAWDVDFESSLNPESRYGGTLEVSQTWTKISLFFNGSEAQSHSLMASISSYSPVQYNFSWQYQTKQKNRSDEDPDRIYHGTAIIMANVDKTGSPIQMEGDYYTDKTRKSYGRICFTKKTT